MMVKMWRLWPFYNEYLESKKSYGGGKYGNGLDGDAGNSVGMVLISMGVKYNGLDSEYDEKCVGVWSLA